jgi:hypothetical protein
VPIVAAGMQSSKLVRNAKFKIYKGAPHGMCTTLKDQVNADLLAFFKSSARALLGQRGAVQGAMTCREMFIHPVS